MGLLVKMMEPWVSFLWLWLALVDYETTMLRLN